MLRKKQGEIEWLEFEILASFPQLQHGVFLRHGGVSDGCFSSLNLLSKNGDDPVKVIENRSRVSQVFNAQELISAEHLHGKEVVLVSKNHPPPPADGFLTAEKNLPLMVTHADCQGAIFYDPIQAAIATVHAGWRGQVHNIYAECIKKMVHCFNSRPADIRVGISPSLGAHNAEFKNFKTELPEEFWPFQVKPTYFDLWAIARSQLLSCGILPEHLEIAAIDTYANDHDFFSYRRGKHQGRKEKVTGCHATIACLKY